MNFKRYCAKMSIETCSIQYENDELMRPKLRRRLRHRLLCFRHAHRQADAVLRRPGQSGQSPAVRHQRRPGREVSGVQVGPELIPSPGDVPGLRRGDAKSTMSSCDWLAGLYVNTLNVIHYMHDKYCYEKIADGPARQRDAAHHGLRRGGPVGGGRLPVRHQIRQGDAPSATRTAWPWILRLRAISPNSATTTPVWMTIAVDVVKRFMTQAAASAPPTANPSPPCPS